MDMRIETPDTVRAKAAEKLGLEHQQREEQAAAYKKLRAGVELSSVDVREIDSQAAELAQRDLAAGRIRASGLGSAIELTEERKDSKAAGQLFNAMLRGQK